MRLRMIESWSRKRMVLAVLGLISVSVVVLMVENVLSKGLFGLPMETHQDNASKLCSKETTCRLCSPAEIKNEPQCWPTGFVRNISCSQTQEGHYPLISCPRFGEKSFWLFECLMVLTGLSSYAVVVMRQNRLNRLLVEKVNRQITSGL